MRDIVTRQMKGGDTSLSILFYSMIVAVLTGGISLPVFGFSLPNWNDIILFATAGIMVSVSHLLIIQALLFAPGATVAPFKYLSLVYAAGIGYVVWGDVPNIGKIVGAALVVLAGLFILHREMNAKKSIS
jgi:drug/metabolite transporter (DMT)-like permease